MWWSRRLAPEPLILVTVLPLNQGGGLQDGEKAEVFHGLRENCQDLVTDEGEKGVKGNTRFCSGWVTHAPSLFHL